MENNDKKKQVKSFTAEFDRINEGLDNRNIDADAVINITEIPISNFQKGMVIVYYKE